ncbi:hypothetical protein TNCV_2341141 [Trichonephila clavipes]|nr:hypothetical protein TNCV_2341141 [Trichonephila clavipes]
MISHACSIGDKSGNLADRGNMSCRLCYNSGGRASDILMESSHLNAVLEWKYYKLNYQTDVQILQKVVFGITTRELMLSPQTMTPGGGPLYLGHRQFSCRHSPGPFLINIR